MTKVVHIAGNLMSSNVHKEIIDRLDMHAGIRSLVIVPTKIGNNERKAELKLWRKDIIFIETPYLLRFFPIFKIALIFFKVLSSHKTKVKNISTWFGHSIWSDGALCFLFSLKSTSKYYLFMRNTDYNIFFKIYWLKPLIKKIVMRSNKIFVPTRTYLKKLQIFYLNKLNQKFTYLPNGISDFWHENATLNDENKKFNDIAYVGKADKNKNFINTFQAIAKLNKDNDVRYFHVVGVSITQFLKITGLRTVPSWVKVYGVISKIELLKIYRVSKVMVLPSYKETFGLVYIEALSQNCKIICSKGQSISLDFIDKPYLKAVEPSLISDIEFNVREHLQGDNNFDASGDLNQFKWEIIINSLTEQCFCNS